MKVRNVSDSSVVFESHGVVVTLEPGCEIVIEGDVKTFPPQLKIVEDLTEVQSSQHLRRLLD